MNRYDLEIVITVFVIVVGIILLFFGMNYAQGVSCRRQWENSGFQSRYTFMTGCMVNPDGNRWIPADTYRVIQ